MKRVHRNLIAQSLIAFLSLCLLTAGMVTVVSCKSASGATDQLSAEEKKARRTAEAFAAQQKTDPYTGWVYVPQKKIDINNGLVRLVLNGSTGTFCIYAKREGASDVPIFSSVDSFASTYFSVKIGRTAYKLSKSGGAKSEARLTPYGAQMAYTISNKAYVVVDFSFLPSDSKSALVDMVRVSVYCINIGKSVQSYAVKGVFDTCLGESTKIHFSTARTPTINTERSFTAMDSDLWIRSGNEQAICQFLLHGKEITEPEQVSLGNKDTIANASWTPSVQENRSFTSVLSFENSSVCINWPGVYLDPLKTDVITFFISLSTDGTAPAGKEFLRELAAGRTALWTRAVSGTDAADSSADTTEADDSAKTETAQTAASEDDALSLFGGASYEPPVKVPPAVEKDTADKSNVTKTDSGARNTAPVDPQLDPEYIQSLIDRIDELNENPSLAKTGEIESLSAELDQILSKLRSGR
ncbi:MAG: hypothetical protein IIT68_03250 [Treponema sp.]|nr:hypothetical protein [Treponema sp.]